VSTVSVPGADAAAGPRRPHHSAWRRKFDQFERGNDLRCAVFEDLKILLSEIADEIPSVVENADRKLDEGDFRTERRLLRTGRSRRDTQCCDDDFPSHCPDS
jgi:ketosteroid isomerase-like protein